MKASAAWMLPSESMEGEVRQCRSILSKSLQGSIRSVFHIEHAPWLLPPLLGMNAET